MNWTRRTKNLVLVGADLLLFLVLAGKLLQEPEKVSYGMTFWTFALPFIVVAVLIVPERAAAARSVHAVLFLATGMAIGLTAGSALRGSEQLWTAELLWLPFGITAAVLHYWPSRRDRYQGGQDPS